MHRSLADHASAPIHEVQITPSARQLTGDFTFPSWIDQWLGPELLSGNRSHGDVRVLRSANAERALIVATVDRAAMMQDKQFIAAARQCYDAIADESKRLGLPHALRIWNAIPNIHDRTTDGDRYMSFNVGRHESMRQLLGDSLPLRVPAATGVGHDGDCLVVGAMLAKTPGTPIDNPRQVPAYQYSSRYGRLPPCFARATRWGSTLFISGTAAVVGEESQFPAAFEQQLDVTVEHLHHLLARAADSDAHGRFTSFRAYLPDRATFEIHRSQVESALMQLADVPVEFVRADLCRKELLVEIEAVAELGFALPTERE